MAKLKILTNIRFAQTAGIAQVVFAFLDLDWDPAVADFHHKAARKFIASPSFGQVSQPLYTSSVSRWRHYADEYSAVSDTLMPYIREFGYEES